MKSRRDGDDAALRKIADGYNLQEKSLLVVSSYPDREKTSIVGTFVKDQVDLVKGYLKQITVIDTVPYVPQPLTKILPKRFKHLNPLLEKKGYSYDNVAVLVPRFLTPPAKKELFDAFRVRAAERAIEKNEIKFDVIHANFTWPGGYIGAKLKEKYKKPLIVSVRGDPFRSVVMDNPNVFKRSKKKILYSLKEADAITTPHPELYEYLCNLGFGEKSEVISKHINLEKFGDKKKYAAEILEFKKRHNLRGKVILFLANLYPPKDPLTFVRAIPRVLKEEKDVTFLIVGGGVLMPDVVKEANALGIADKCRITGQLSKTNIAYMCSDIFCALSPIENIWSSTVMEALASGVSSIVTRAGTTERFLRHEKTAYLIKPESPGELAAAIVKLLRDDKLRATIAKNGRAFAEENWMPSQVAKKWLNLYGRLSNQASR